MNCRETGADAPRPEPTPKENVPFHAEGDAFYVGKSRYDNLPDALIEAVVQTERAGTRATVDPSVLKKMATHLMGGSRPAAAR